MRTVSRYRDSMLLMGYQLVTRDPALVAWQQAILPQPGAGGRGRGGNTPTVGYWAGPEQRRRSSLYRHLVGL